MDLECRLAVAWRRLGAEPAAARREIEFAPRWTGNLSCDYTPAEWTFNLQAQTVGPMRLPAVADLPLHSTPYVLAHASAGRRFGKHTLRVGMKNVSDTRQPTPLVAANAPFSEAFDASRIYGPIEGRRLFLEWQVAF